MMTKQEIRELYKKEVNTPYTTEELEFHMCDRRLKSLLEIMHSHNYELIYLAFDTRRYLFEGGPKPEGRLALLLRPGANNDNAACARLRQIAKCFGEYERSETPLMPIIAYASRSSITLVNALEELFFHESIFDLYHHAKEFFALITDYGPTQMTHEEFAQQLLAEADAFIEAMTIYSRALYRFIHEREVEMREGRKAVLVEIKQPEKVSTPRRKSNNLGKGPQTDFKLKQRQTFLTYLKHHPVTLSQSIITLAHKCWIEQQAEWDVAARSGEGYFNYKSLARAV